MTSRQRLAFIILQLNGDYTCWNGALRQARAAARGCTNPESLRAAEAVRASLRAADAAIATIRTEEVVAVA
jgi:hypothetical protein